MEILLIEEVYEIKKWKYHMKNRLLIISLFALSYHIYGQKKNYHLDTLIIDINEHIVVKIASYDNAWLNQYEGFNSRIEHFQNDLLKIQYKISQNQNLLLRSGKIGEITISTTGNSFKYIISDTLESYKQNRAIILNPKYEIIIDFREVNNLVSTDIQKCVNIVAAYHERDVKEFHGLSDYSAKIEKRHTGVAFNLHFKCANDSAIFDPDHSRYNDMKSQ